MRVRSIEFRPGVSIIPAILLLFCACSEDPGAPADTTPPTAVNDLVAINPSWNSIMLTWTAPGDDGRTGTAAQYDIRYSQNPLTEAIWPSAEQATGEPSPRPAGSADTFVVTGLTPTTTYYFALKTADAEGNWSAKSIIASAPTTAVIDNVPPAAVADLAASASATNAVTLTWTAPGDDGALGTAALYDIRYSKSPITDANWSSAWQAGGEPPPKPAGSPDSFVVQYLAPGTIYYFALKTTDEKPNWSALSNVVSGETQTP
ncbi:MAG: fibronectin type III domain-containing protein [Candidatus Krumholzibacteriia bacterium]